MRCPLLLPLGDRDALDAALRSGADALVLDLGGTSAPASRLAGREAVLLAVSLLRAARPDLPGGGTSDTVRPLTVVGLAPLPSGLVDADLDAVMGAKPDAVLLPGAAGARDLQHLAAKLAVREAEHGVPAGRTGILAVVADTAAGVLALPALPGASPRLRALVWDAAALAASLGVGVGASPVRAARDALLIAAAAAGVPALDRGLPGGDVARACGLARRVGFSGRFASRPEEVAVATGVFTSGAF